MHFARGQGVRHGPAQIVWQEGCAHRIRVASRYMPSAARILNLSEQPAIFTLYRISPAFQAVKHAVVPGDHAVVALVRGNDQRLGHHHRCAALGAIGVVVDLPVLDAVLGAEVRRDRGVDDAVFERLAGQCVRRKKIRIGFVTVHWGAFGDWARRGRCSEFNFE